MSYFYLARTTPTVQPQLLPFILSADNTPANGQQVVFTTPEDLYLTKVFCCFSTAPTGGNNSIELRIDGTLLTTVVVLVNTTTGYANLPNTYVPAGSVIKIDQTVHPATHGQGLIAWLTVLPR